jgi:hypothetical protein
MRDWGFILMDQTVWIDFAQTWRTVREPIHALTEAA